MPESNLPDEQPAPNGCVTRPARAEDVGALATVARRIFYDTFARFNTPEDMEAYCAEAFSPDAIAEAIRNPHTDVLIAMPTGADGREIPAPPMAYAHMFRGRTHETVMERTKGPWAELKRFYVDHAFHGTGVAQRLMRAVAERAIDHGAASLWLAVWEHNDRAISFYRKLGFVEAGTQQFALGADVQNDLVFAVPLGELIARTTPGQSASAAPR